jgi:HD superfamily phosphohydrolase YqeK
VDNEDDYLSHPIEEPKHSLLQQDVAHRTKELLSYTAFQNPELGKLAGLLHDLGKLNPYYQILFRTDEEQRDAVKKKLSEKYVDIHSPYSAWIADNFLHMRIGLRGSNLSLIRRYPTHK